MAITRKPIEIPPEVARQFAADMQAYHSERDHIRRDRIAADTRHVLLEHMPARGYDDRASMHPLRCGRLVCHRAATSCEPSGVSAAPTNGSKTVLP